MSELVARAGVPRTSIHFYLREGLLPQPHKTAANRSFYTEDHVVLLRRIKALQGDGSSLAEIKQTLGAELAHISERDVDLLRRENERVRKTILRVATEEFMSHGYQQTRVTDIIRKSGVSSQIFYSHFPSKGELLVESFRTFVSWNLAFVEPKLQTADPGERLLWRMLADARANEFGSSVLSLIRAEGFEQNGSDLPRMVEQAWAPIMGRIALELQDALKEGVQSPVPLELLAYSLIGAHHNSSLRASWDERYSREDVLATHLWLFLTVMDALSEEPDPDSCLVRYRDLMKEVAAREPESPPAIEE